MRLSNIKLKYEEIFDPEWLHYVVKECITK